MHKYCAREARSSYICTRAYVEAALRVKKRGRSGQGDLPLFRSLTLHPAGVERRDTRMHAREHGSRNDTQREPNRASRSINRPQHDWPSTTTTTTTYGASSRTQRLSTQDAHQHRPTQHPRLHAALLKRIIPAVPRHILVFSLPRRRACSALWDHGPPRTFFD